MGNANDEEPRLQAGGIVSLYTPRISVGYRNPGVGGYFPSSGKLVRIRVIMGVRSETPLGEWSRNPVRALRRAKVRHAS